MLWAGLVLIAVALAISLPASWLLIRLGHRAGTLDTAPIPGQVKLVARPIPNTGGIAIFAAIVLPMLVGLLVIQLMPEALVRLVPPLADHLPGIGQQIPSALVLIACLTAVHLLGVIDDRRPLGPWLKLALIAGASLVVIQATDTRLLTLLDARVGGSWLSVLVTLAWFVVVTNAMNFMDNMDGLTGGVTAIAAGCLLAVALLGGQWFVASTLALLVGATLGFLVWNLPPAKLFMGDGGSLVVGFLLAFLTTRTTYLDLAANPAAGSWHMVLVPLIVLAIPLYDFASVTLIRLRQGKSPLVGDLQHFSHRLTRRGLSPRQVVLVVYTLTAATGLGSLLLGSLTPWQSILVAAQALLLVLVIALLEYASAGPSP